MPMTTDTQALIRDALALVGRHRPAGYQASREVNARAAATRSEPAGDLRTAVQRLDRLMNSEHPPRTDAPRGYYLNIQV